MHIYYLQLQAIAEIICSAFEPLSPSTIFSAREKYIQLSVVEGEGGLEDKDEMVKQAGRRRHLESRDNLQSGRKKDLL